MTIIPKREAGCSVVVIMLIMIMIIINITRVRDEAELGDQMLGRRALRLQSSASNIQQASLAPNTAIEAAPAHSSREAVTTTPTPKAAHPLPLVLVPS
jgi:hypothetical protein